MQSPPPRSLAWVLATFFTVVPIVDWGAIGREVLDRRSVEVVLILRRACCSRSEAARCTATSGNLSTGTAVTALPSRDNREAMYFQRIIGAFSPHFIQSEAKWDGGVQWLNALGADPRVRSLHPAARSHFHRSPAHSLYRSDSRLDGASASRRRLGPARMRDTSHLVLAANTL